MGRLAGNARFRLVVVVLLSMLPAFGLMTYAVSEQQEMAARAAERDAFQTAQRVSAEQEHLIQGARELLTALSELPAVAGTDSAACDAALSSWKRSYPAYAAFWVNAPDGAVTCGAPPPNGTLSDAESEWFGRVMAARRFTVGDYQIGRDSGRPVLPLTYPVLDQDGEVVQVIGTALDLARLSANLDTEHLIPGTTVTVIDRDGTILAMQPPLDGVPGRSAVGTEIGDFALATGSGTTRAMGLTGSAQLVGVAPFAAGSGATVSVGVPLEVAVAQGAELRNRMSLLLLGGTALTLALALYGTEVALLRRVRTVIRMARRLEAGDLTARSNLNLGGELETLSRAFDSMATALAEREQVLRRREAWYRLLLYSGRDAVFVYPLTPEGAAGTFVEVNDEACARLGYTREELLRLSIADICERAAPGEPADFAARLRKSGDLLIEGTHAGKDGGRVPVEISMRLLEVDGQELVVSVARDVTERRRAAADLAASERRHRALIEHGNDLILVVDGEGVIRDVSPSVERLFGFAPEAVTGTPVLDWVHQEDWAAAGAALRAAQGSTLQPRTEVRVRHAKAGWRTLDVYVSNLLDEPGVGGIVVTGRDVTEQRRDQENLARQARELRALAVTDELTGLRNRRGFMMIAEQHLALAQRSGSDVALLFADMDGLKQINDTHGHQAGSDALVAAAQILRDTFRESDVIARIGGDEFVVLAHCSAPNAVQTLIERLDRAVEHYNRSSGCGYTLSLSFGSALYDPRHPTELDQMLVEADRAMYEDKRRRRAERAA